MPGAERASNAPQTRVIAGLRVEKGALPGWGRGQSRIRTELRKRHEEAGRRLDQTLPLSPLRGVAVAPAVDAWVGPLALCMVELYQDSVLVRWRETDPDRWRRKHGMALAREAFAMHDSPILRDDRRTGYERVPGGGGGANGNGAAEFVPSPPPEASVLEVGLGPDTFELDLGAFTRSPTQPRPVHGYGPYQVIPAPAELGEGRQLQSLELYEGAVALRMVRRHNIGIPATRRLAVRDDIGTAYRYAEGFSSGRHDVLWFKPAVPSDATRLDIDVEGARGVNWVHDAGRGAIHRITSSATRRAGRLTVTVDSAFVAAAGRDEPITERTSGGLPGGDQ